MKLVIHFKHIHLLQGIPVGSDLWEMWKLAIEMHCWNIPHSEIRAELQEFEGCFNNGNVDWKVEFTDIIDTIIHTLASSAKQDHSALLCEYDGLTLDDIDVLDSESLILEFNNE